MKLEITDVVVHRLSVPLPRPVRTARHDHAHADTVAVEMRTGAGLVGAGYCFAFGARRARALAELVEDLAEVYVGRAPAPQARHAEAWRALNFIGHAGPSLLALAALDTACWDLAARAVNLPLFRVPRRRPNARAHLRLQRALDRLQRGRARARGRGLPCRRPPRNEDAGRPCQS